MLNAIISLSMRYKVIVLVLFLIGVAYGINSFRQVPVDAFPDVTPVQVNIYTEASGLASEDIEKLFTVPIESSMAGLANVEEIRSVSLFGLSYVSLYFSDTTDIYTARRLVSEKIQEIENTLPPGYAPPTLGGNSSGLGQVYWYTVESKEGSANTMDLRSVQDWSIRMILRTASGVDDVVSWGGDEKQYQVTLNPDKMISYNIDLQQVLTALTDNNRQVGGQSINIGPEQLLIRGAGQVQSLNDLANILVTSINGNPIYIRDIARVENVPAIRTGAVTKNGKEVVLGMALSRINENAKDVVNNVKGKLETVNSILPENMVLDTLYDRTDLVDKALGTAKGALVEGAILVAIILFLFLGELRSALIVIITLPASMLLAFILMKQFGISANLMSLAGLAVGTGMMVDGAVVMVENIYRRLAIAKEHGEPFNKATVILTAAKEVSAPITFAIMIIIVVFAPLFSLDGLEGKLFKPMAQTISFAMLGSLLLSLTLVPVLSFLILKPADEKDTFIVKSVKRIYLPLLNKVLNNKSKVIVASGVTLILSLLLVPFLGKEFMPQLQEGNIMFRVTSIASTSLDESIRLSAEIDQNIRQRFPEVTTVLATIGRAEKGETSDVNYMEILLNLKPQPEWRTKITYSQLAQKIQEQLENEIPTVVFSATQPIQMRIDELISGVRASLALKVYGPDSKILDTLTAQLQSVLAEVKGVSDLSTEANKGKSQLVIKVNSEKAAAYGVSADDVLKIVETGIGGSRVSTFIDNNARFDIVARFDTPFRDTVAAISAIPIRSASGALVSLSQVTDISQSEGYSFLRREGLQRYSILEMNVIGRDTDGFVKEANELIQQKVSLPNGYWLEWGGTFENQQRAMKKLAIILPLTIGLIFLLLYTVFNAFRYAALVIANVPFAMVGGIIALFISNQYLSVPSAIGFITVFGVSMLNGIVMVSFFNELRQQGLSVRESIQQGAALRLRPVLITATVAILGLLPMLLASGTGAEVQRPLATVVIGGLLTSTLLTLLLLPLFYEMIELHWERKKSDKLNK